MPLATISFAVLLQFVLNTSPDVGDLREVMAYIYEHIYVEYVTKNPLYSLGDPFQWVSLAQLGRVDQGLTGAAPAPACVQWGHTRVSCRVLQD